MNETFTDLFTNWQLYVNKINELYARLKELTDDLGISINEVKIWTFVSSSWRAEIKYCCVDENSSKNDSFISSPMYLKSKDIDAVKIQLSDLLDVNNEQAIFLFNNSYLNEPVMYNEWGALDNHLKDICLYGVVVEYKRMKYSTIVRELFSQISLLCLNILEYNYFEVEEFRLANLVYMALKKQIDVDFFNTLSASYYEKRVASGGICLIDDDSADAQKYELKIRFKDKYRFGIENVRQIRKLLEMTSDELFLISNDGFIIGIGSCAERCDTFKFHDHQCWSYYKNGIELLSYKEGKYTFLFGSYRNFALDFPKNFIKDDCIHYINSLLNDIRDQNHGTLLIVTDEAQAEVERLCALKRGYAIYPVDLKNPENKCFLNNITSIDGAAFTDTSLICYGVGIILDGIALKAGKSSRGSRYNSARCYIDGKTPEKYTAIVISSDETIDIIYNKNDNPD